MEMTGGSTGLRIGEGISLYGSSGKSYWGDRHMFSCILDFFSFYVWLSLSFKVTKNYNI